MSTGYIEKSLWLLAGAGIGAGAVFLFGTAEGRRVRRRVRHWAEDSRERLVEGSKELYERSRELADDARDAVGRGWRVLRKAS